MRFRMIFAVLLCCILPVVSGGKELQIIATCDIHGSTENFSRLAPVIRSYPDAVKIDLGDLFHGDPLCDVTYGAPMIAALNALKYDIFVPGNHEFELSRDRFISALSGFDGTLLGQYKCGNLKVLPWKIVERNGFRCAVIGMTDNGIYRNRRFYPDFEIIEEIYALDRALAEIRKQKTDAVILARHGGTYFSGVPAGRVLYRRPEIDLVICGHTHKEIAGMRRGRSFFVQPGPFAQSAVLITLCKNSLRGVFIWSRLLRPGKYADKTVSAIFKRAYADKRTELNAGFLPAMPMKDFAEKVLAALKKSAGTDCAVIDLPEFPEKPLSYREFLKLFPYRNQLLVVNCTAGEYAAFCRERPPARRKRFASKIPAGKNEITVVLNTFQLSRSRTFPADKEFRLIPFIERDVIGRVSNYAETLRNR